MVTPFLPDDEKIPAIREALPATAAGIYLNTGTAGPLPREVAHGTSGRMQRSGGPRPERPPPPFWVRTRAESP